MELWWNFDCDVLKMCNFIWIARKSVIYENLKFLEFCLDPETKQDVTPRPKKVHNTCNCRGAYVHQVSL